MKFLAVLFLTISTNLYANSSVCRVDSKFEAIEDGIGCHSPLPNGDCYLQNIYFRFQVVARAWVAAWSVIDGHLTLQPLKGIDNMFGIYTGVVSENEYNNGSAEACQVANAPATCELAIEKAKAKAENLLVKLKSDGICK